MLGHDRSDWKPWFQKTYKRNSSQSSYNGVSPRDGREKSKGLVLFVRIAQDDKSESKCFMNLLFIYYNLPLVYVGLNLQPTDS